jgi:hypothetical protein
MKTNIQKMFAPFKKLLPSFIWRPIRAIITGLITPVVFSIWSGHFKSSLLEKAVSRHGDPLPWYTYPCIHLLQQTPMAGRKVLEFGGGQSTLWWAAHAEQVVSLEADKTWHDTLAKRIPDNVNLHHVDASDERNFLARVDEILKQCGIDAFDIVVIDAEFREVLVPIGLSILTSDGALVCDDAESYGFYEASCNLDVQRVDFFGHAPGVVLPKDTAVFFKSQCFLFGANKPIPDMAVEMRN